jgi:hypothetical protein
VTDLPREVTAAHIAQLLKAVDDAAKRAGYEGRGDVLDLADLSEKTGIRQGRVLELLTGADPEQPPKTGKEREAYYRRVVGQRLEMLRTRKADSDQRLRTIGEEIDLSHTLVGHLVNGTRSTRVEYSSPLEERYDVPHGWLSKPEGQALAECLTKLKNGLLAGAMYTTLKALGGQEAALRYTGSEPLTMELLLGVAEELEARMGAKKAAEPGSSREDLK